MGLAEFPGLHQSMPEVMPRMALNAQQRVQPGMASLSYPLFSPVGTLALGNYRNYFLLHSQLSEHPVKGNGGNFEENSMRSALVSRADRACCADTSGLQQGEGEINGHDRNDSSSAAL